MAILKTGHPVTIGFAADASIAWAPKSIKLPGISGGAPIDTTPLSNNNYRQKAPRKLKELTPGSMVVAFDPAVLVADMTALVNNNTLITITHPDSTTWVEYGFVTDFDPNEQEDGVQPTANVAFQPSATHSVTGAETGPA